MKAAALQAKFLIVGKEVGEQGTPHLQGFISLKSKHRLTGVKKLLGSRAHLEQARGSDADNEKYCSKGGNILIREGEPTEPRQRSDLKSAVQLLLETKNLGSVAREFPEVYCRSFRGLAQLLTDHPDMQISRAWKTDVILWIGPPGCGKSSGALAASSGNVYWKPRGKWWDGYNRHDTVIIDDFYGWLPFDDLLRICDRYPLRVETKGGTREFVAKTIHITSNRSPCEWYSDEITNKDAFFRRVTEIKWHAFGGSVKLGEFGAPPDACIPYKINY